ncbi:allantoicase [Yinghuangia seranimata]|uniref:allantoicase n=1 Tax=Yinghuangia seranimata TaxID=408067 RepID=UPI00248B2CB8|nr:allantoicase [Yinghuangia seranimata]MDI2131512.1 allantoicase [Yinghuangia seranimata]
MSTPENAGHNTTDFTELPNLAARPLGAGVVAANDEWFADKENLLLAETPVFQPHTFGPKGQIMDGWETRRRRGVSAEEPHVRPDDHDWAVVRLGAAGVVRGVVVDTAHFVGNYPPYASVEAAYLPGHPDLADVLADDVAWTEIVPRSPLKGDTAHRFDVAVEKRFTHVRLNIFPDGGVARLRVHGEVVPDADYLDGLMVDVAAADLGGVAEAASDRFFSSPHNINAPGRSRVMGEGWETRRRRDDGHDWVRIKLAGPADIAAVEIDTDHYKGNAPGWIRLVATDGTPEDEASWYEILPRTRVQPDTRHRFRVAPGRSATHVRVEVYPCGGVARLRLLGRVTDAGLAELRRRTAELDAD